MPGLMHFSKFGWKGSDYRICSTHVDTIIDEIKRQRYLLELYIKEYPVFLTSLIPIPERTNAPISARMMHRASKSVGVGPMAAVAGTLAQLASERAIDKGAKEVVIDNGGDLYLVAENTITVGLYTRHQQFTNQLAVRVVPAAMPIAICSSSGVSGRSFSLGTCDLATVISKDGALADAAATFAANFVKGKEDINRALQATMKIEGILGLLIVKDDAMGLAGDFPPLIRQEDRNLLGKITGF